MFTPRRALPGADHWVLCSDFVQGPYNALGAQHAKARSDASECKLPHAIVRAAVRPDSAADRADAAAWADELGGQ
jgi:hypothetical protein